MTTPPAGTRYQSRLLNFLSRQSLRLKDNLGQAWRHVKVATEWGVQMVFYPIYLAVQTARMVGKQLQATVGQALPQLRAALDLQDPPTVDTPITHVLETVAQLLVSGQAEFQSLPSSDSQLLASTSAIAHTGKLISLEATQISVLEQVDLQAWDLVVAIPGKAISQNPGDSTLATNAAQTLPKRQSLTIQGLACLLTQRTLVLVTTANQILDILTPDQQKLIYQKMAWEVAGYQRYQRSHLPTKTRFNPQLQSPSPTATHLLPPVRWFQQLMVWVQQSPIAVSINLFQESVLIPQPPTPNPQPPTPNLQLPTPNPHSLRYADHWLSQLEAKLSRLPLFQSLSPTQSQTLGTPNGELDAWEDENTSIRALIRAAVDYFFGDRGWSLPWQKPIIPRLAGDVSEPNLFELSEGDCWLTFGELFGNPTTQPNWVFEQPLGIVGEFPGQPAALELEGTSARQRPALRPATAALSFSTPEWVAALGAFTEKTLRALFPQRLVSAQPPATTTIEVASSAIAPTSATPSFLQRMTSSEEPTDALEAIAPTSTFASLAETALGVFRTAGSDMKATASDPLVTAAEAPWIDTEATVMGYEKHPLEQLLEWLDRLIAWVENAVITLVQKLRRKHP